MSPKPLAADQGDPAIAFRPASEFRITIPAQAGSLFYVRLFVGAVARPLAVGDEKEQWIDELKLLVTEAASFALEGSESFSVVLRPSEAALECRISPVTSFEPSDMKLDPFDLVTTLASSAELVGSDLVLTVAVE
ncbi:MAG: hypothetical protein KJO36_07265 [Acidimicrobiia bacterium]|nr:hypothetical protein [Acidimicrobiia bacterium]